MEGIAFFFSRQKPAPNQKFPHNKTKDCKSFSKRMAGPRGQKRAAEAEAETGWFCFVCFF